MDKNIKNQKIRKDFFTGFRAGLVGFGIVAFVLLLVFAL